MNKGKITSIVLISVMFFYVGKKTAENSGHKEKKQSPMASEVDPNFSVISQDHKEASKRKKSQNLTHEYLEKDLNKRTKHSSENKNSHAKEDPATYNNPVKEHFQDKQHSKIETPAENFSAASDLFFDVDKYKPHRRNTVLSLFRNNPETHLLSIDFSLYEKIQIFFNSNKEKLKGNYDITTIIQGGKVFGSDDDVFSIWEPFCIVNSSFANITGIQFPDFYETFYKIDSVIVENPGRSTVKISFNIQDSTLKKIECYKFNSESPTSPTNLLKKLTERALGSKLKIIPPQ